MEQYKGITLHAIIQMRTHIQAMRASPDRFGILIFPDANGAVLLTEEQIMTVPAIARDPIAMQKLRTYNRATDIMVFVITARGIYSVVMLDPEA